MKNRSGILSWIIKICLLIAGIWLLQKLDILPSLNKIFTAKPVVIDETPILIKEIKALGQVITATAYDEVVVDSSRGSLLGLPGTKTQLVLIARGRVLAGINLKQITGSMVKVSGDTVWMQLPPTGIIDVIINPRDYEIFVENGNWNPEAVTSVKLKAKEKIRSNALEQKIIEKAEQKANAVMKDFLHAAGFKVVLFSPWRL